jgi:predicted AAA+ superfamily ATPase
MANFIADQTEHTFFDLENPTDYTSIIQSPMLQLESLEGLIVLDEVQRVAEIFPILRVLADKPKKKFLILGSASPNLTKVASESLAGRISFIDMSGFSLEDLGQEYWKNVWLRGSFPRSYLAQNDQISFSWRENYIRSFLERDIPQMGISIPSSALRRFWTMTAHYHGQIWNGSEFARSIGATEPTARRYIDILTDAYVVRQLQPWYENLKKRQIKSPKIYVRDSGLLHALLNLPDNKILTHPKLGGSWEGFIIEQILEITNTREAYFWATHAGAELDLLIFKGGKRIGFEVKYSDAPSRTRSMSISLQDLNLERLYIIYPGDKSYPLDYNIQVVGMVDFLNAIDNI